jgi:hypothetical protein
MILLAIHRESTGVIEFETQSRRTGRLLRHHPAYAQAADMPAMALLLDRFHRARQFAPQLAEDEITPSFSNSPQVLLPRTFVARTGQRVVATVNSSDKAPKRIALMQSKRSAFFSRRLLFLSSPSLLLCCSSFSANFRSWRPGVSSAGRA